jgi:hypothetical protein
MLRDRGAYGRGKWVDYLDANLALGLGWGSDTGMGRPVT